MAKDRINDQCLEKNQVAGNGLLDRRLFLKKGLQFGAISTFASSTAIASTNTETKNEPAHSPWMHEPGKPFSIYGKPSEFEDDVVRFSHTE